MLLSAALLTDLNAGANSSYPIMRGEVDGTVFFDATNTQGQTGLFRTDGTAAGTTFLLETQLDGYSTAGLNGVFYFTFENQLWRSDGTAAGTFMLKNKTSSAGSGLLTPVGNEVFFNFGNTLWKTDGTIAGTVLVQDQFGSQVNSANITNMLGVGNTLYFADSTDASGNELWKSDGTAAGTVMVKDIEPGAVSSSPTELTAYNGQVYFAITNNNGNRSELWRSDGTSNGTVMVLGPFDQGNGGNNGIGGFAVYNGLLYFSAADPTTGIGSLYSTNGTPGNFTIVQTVNASVLYPAISGGLLYFSSQYNLWRSDGTNAGTYSILAPYPNGNIDPGSLRDVNGHLFFVANDATHGTELWTSNGTSAGTVLYQDIWVGNQASSNPSYLTDASGLLIFAANDGNAHGVEPWVLSEQTAVPAAVATLSPVVISGGEIDLNWTDPAEDRNGFILERSLTSNFSSIGASYTLPGGVTHFADIGLTPSTTYFYRIRAYNSVGPSANVITSAIAGQPDPNAPSNVSASFGDPGVTVIWTDNSNNETGFHVQRSKLANFASIDFTASVAANVTSYLDSTTSPDTTYYYRVSSLNGNGASAPAVSPALNTPAAAPTALFAAQMSAASVALGWSDPDVHVTGYQVERQVGAGPFAILANGGNIDTSVTAGMTVTYRVRSKSAAGLSTPSNTSTVTVIASPATAAPTVNQNGIPSDANPGGFLTIHPGLTVFTATDSVHGQELWVTNGTTAGTSLLMDIFPGPTGSNPYPLGVVSSVALFGATDPVHGTEIWRSDGTVAGTFLLKDINPGLGSSNPFGGSGGNPTPATLFNGALYFAATDGVHGSQLWKSDGTPAGTVMVTDLFPSASGSVPTAMAVVGNKLFFEVGPNPEIFVTDGTSPGTAFVASISLGSLGTGGLDFRAVNGKLVFNNAAGPASQYQLWSSDGTAAGTVQLDAGNPGVVYPSPQPMALIGATLYFAWTDPVNGFGLWKTDGTDAGTSFITPFIQTPSTTLLWATPLNGKLVYDMHIAGTGDALYGSDGSAAGTTLLRFFKVGNGTSSGFAVTGNMVIFAAIDPINGNEVWKSDGTSAGTVLLQDIAPGGGGSLPQNFANAGGPVYFSAFDAVHGVQLWQTDGTTVSQILIAPGPFAPTDPSAMYDVNGKLLFFAVSPQGGERLYETDGTTTSGVLNPNTDPNLIFDGVAAVAGGKLYFEATQAGSQGYGIWMTDGTSAGTMMVPGSDALGQMAHFFPASSGVYFSLGDPNDISIHDLYFANASGVRLVTSQGVGNVTTMGDGAFFQAGKLFYTNGTQVGTYALTSVTNAKEFVVVKNLLYYVADSPLQGLPTLYMSDGSVAGTQAIYTAQTGYVFPTADLNGSLYFATSAGIWKNSGNPAQNLFVASPIPNFSIQGMQAIGAWLYIFGGASAGGTSIYRLSASTPTPQFVAVVPTNNLPTFLDQDGTAYMLFGTSLWRTDGTTAGTHWVADVDTSFTGPSAAVSNGTLFFGYGAAPAGDVLFSIAPPVAAPTVLTATPISGNEIDLAWTDHSGGTAGALIERRDNNGAWYTIATLQPGVASYHDVSVAAGIPYSYRVASTVASGSSAFSNIAGAHTPGVIPSAPTTLTALDNSPTEVDLQWTPAGAAPATYSIERAVGVGPFVVVQSGISGNNVEFSDGVPQSDVTYTYRVQAHNTAGDSGYSPTATVTPLDHVPPTPFNFTISQLSLTQAKLSWQSAAFTGSFKIFGPNSFQGSYITVAGTGVNNFTYNYTDTINAGAGTYPYQIIAHNYLGDSQSANDTITISNTPVNQSPFVVQAAAASVNGTTVALSVLGGDDGGEANLIYTWTNPSVVFSNNGTNSAKMVTATLSAAGTYGFTVTVKDQQGLTDTSTVNVIVNQTPTTLTLSPPNAILRTFATQLYSFTLTDQFGAAVTNYLSSQIQYSATGGGSIDSNGRFTAGPIAGPFTVSVTADGLNTSVNGTAVYPPGQPGDGGFESPALSAGASQNEPTGTPWVFTHGSGSYHAGIARNGSALTANNGNAPEGTQVAFIQGDSSISQIVNFAQAGYYSIAGFIATTSAGGAFQEMQILVDGAVAIDFNNASTAYTLIQSDPFAVSAGNHTIAIRGLNLPGAGATSVLDNIQIVGGPPLTPTIPNSGFESPVAPAGGVLLEPGAVTWTYQGGPTGFNSGVSANGSSFTSGNPNAPQGAQVALLEGDSTISQNIVNWPAGWYTITLSAAQRQNVFNGGEDFNVTVDGALLATMTPAVAGTVATIKPTSFSYADYTTAPFYVSAGNHAISFIGLDTAKGDNTALIDNIRATVAPPPAPSIPDFGFENPSHIPLTSFYYSPLGTSWSFQPGSGQFGSGITGNYSAMTSSNPNAPEGLQAAFLQGDSSFSQTISGWQAGMYILTLAAAQRGVGNHGGEDFNVQVDGTVVGTFKPASFLYGNLTTIMFTVAAGAHTITFQGLDSIGGDNVALIDNVQITAALTPPITNASFETPPLGSGSFQYSPLHAAWVFTAGTAPYGSGISAGGSAFTQNNPNAPDGAQVGLLQANSAISQSINGWLAERYTLTLSAAQRATGNHGGENFQVLIDSTVVATIKPTTTTYQDYTTLAFTISAAGTHNLSFQGLDTAGGDNTALLDNVRISFASYVPPTLNNISLSTAQNLPLAFAAANFTGAFIDSNVNETLQQVKITSLPGHGALTLASVAVSLNQVIPISQIANLAYTPAHDYVGSDTFGWNGADLVGYAITAAIGNLMVNPVPVALTTPATATSVNAGSTFQINWTGGASTDTIQLWAEGGPNNAWTELTAGVPDSNHSYTWNTTGVPHGWYNFAAWDIPQSGSSYQVFSPNYLHVVNPNVTQAPTVTLLNPPLAADHVNQGTSYAINWTTTEQAGDTNPVSVQIWVYSGNTGQWSILPNAGAIVSAASGNFYAWATTGVAPGWYAFAAHVTDGDLWGPGNSSPGWLNITVPTPTIAFTTPSSGQSVAAGANFNLNWNITGLPGSDVSNSTVQIWAQHLVNGSSVWSEIAASVNAANGTYSWSVPASPGAGTYYAFSIYLNYGADWWVQASPNWLHVT